MSFERLGVRLLRKADTPLPSSTKPRPSTPSRDVGTGSFLVASFMLYGLSAEGKASTDISILGRLEGVHVQDISPVGRKYPDILVIGVGEEPHPLKPVGEEPHTLKPAHCLSFSITRCPGSSISLPGSPPHGHTDVHLSAFVPAIHYLHSVNFVYEIERFVSEFIKYFNAAVIKSAAVGVAKGLVRQESQLAKSLSRLHTSFGHAQMTPPPEDAGGEEEGDVPEDTDPRLPFRFGGNKLYFDISVQSPVIVVPSSLSKEDCLVAHLGEITAKNEYISYPYADSTALVSEELVTSSIPPSTSTPPSIERVVLTVSNISLHATHTEESRLELESFSPGQRYPQHCSKVVRETSMVIQVDKRLAPRGSGHADVSFDSVGGEDADLRIKGRVCDPLLIDLPKAVFDQLKTTLKHGVRRKVRRSSRVEEHVLEGEGPFVKGEDLEGANLGPASEKTVHFDPVVKLQESAAAKDKQFPDIFATFSLPKLSLELKHVIDHADRSLVLVRLDDLSAQYRQSDMDFVSVDLALKSIVIEDLLQPKRSEYRNILASSSKPLPFPLSPVAPMSSSKLLRNMSHLQSPLTQHIFPLSHMMSTPKPVSPLTDHSPLRSFDSSNERRATPTCGRDETGSTVREEGSTCSEASTDLLTVRACYVDEHHPLFQDKYDSVSGLAIILC